MSPDATPLAITQHAIALWNEVAAAYDAIERRLGAGAWEGFDEVATHIAKVERELQPMLVTIAAIRADGTTHAEELQDLWRQLDDMVEALARRQKQLERAAVSARDTTAARLVRTRIARSRAAGYTPLNPLSPRFTSRRV
jgi:ABC-type transporter Mla subunit MlaD